MQLPSGPGAPAGHVRVLQRHVRPRLLPFFPRRSTRRYKGRDPAATRAGLVQREGDAICKAVILLNVSVDVFIPLHDGL